jgi:hypothetical protein
MIHNHQICNQGVINKESTCEKITKPTRTIIQPRRSETFPTKYLHQMIWCHEEKGLHENVSPQFNPMLQEYQQQIAINVMTIYLLPPSSNPSWGRG